MTITVLDTLTGMTSVLDSPAQRREERLRTMLEPVRGMFRYFPGDVDPAAIHAMSMGFPLDRDGDAVHDALGKLEEADAWARIASALDHAVGIQMAAVPGLKVPDLTFLLVVGDPGDEYFMGPARGLSGNGSVTGYISLTVWPTQENLDRLEAAAVHELNHNLRYAPGGVVWDPATVAVGEQIVSEGLADAFARQLYGEAGYTPFAVPHLENDEILHKVVTGLAVRDMRDFTAWVHGDPGAVRFGVEPVGLPMGAGYAVGNRIVDAYLEATGKNAAQALHDSGDAIIATALLSMGIDPDGAIAASRANG
ncbi:DUF2268 domain-containing putative Zn-dependent protease [Actinomycetaceae bacterium L2_0104]